MPPRRRFGKRLIKSFLPIALVIVLAVVGALSFVVYCVSRPDQASLRCHTRFVLDASVAARSKSRMKHGPTATDATRAAGCSKALKARRQLCCFIVTAAIARGSSISASRLTKRPTSRSSGPICAVMARTRRSSGPRSAVAKETICWRRFKYLRGLKSENQKTLVGESFGVYGVELGAYSALKAAREETLRSKCWCSIRL